MKRKSLAEMSLISFALLLSVSCSPCQAIELLHWTFDQVNSDGAPTPVLTTPDLSGRGNTGTLTSMDIVDPVPGRVGNALQFTNVGTSTATRDRVQIATPAPNPDPVLTDFNRTYNQFTFAAFIKPIAIAPDDVDIALIAGKIGGSGNRGWQIGWTGTDPAGVPAPHPQNIVVSIFDGPSGADNEVYAQSAAIANDVWAHVAFTFSGINEAQSFLRIYINGAKVLDEPTTLAQMNGVNSLPFQVGNRGDSRRDTFGGLIDDVHVYDNALNDAEIAALIPPLPPVQVGDFNQNGKVDGADYVLWRKNFGSASALPNDNGTTLPVGVDHYNLWRSKFGNGAGSGAGFESGGAVPEPASAFIAAMASAFLLSGFGRGGRD